MIRSAVFLPLGVAFVVVLAAAGPLPAQQPTVAKATSPAASFSARKPGGEAFEVLPENAELRAGDLLVTLPGASLTNQAGTITLKSLADYDGKSPLPILETAIRLHEAQESDLDFTLDRGRVDLTNTKASGPVSITARFWDQTWKITLDTPGTRVALELCGRWSPGSRFKPLEKGTQPAPAPTASLVLLVEKGGAAVDLGGYTLGLKAPPGPAMVEWDSLAGTRPQAQKLDKLPDWANLGATLSEAGKKAADAVEKFRKARAENPIAATRDFLASNNPVEQRVALVTLGAFDDLDQLIKELTSAKTTEEWSFGITVLRHWLGRCAGHDQKLYQMLTEPALGYSPAQAGTILQLLFGFGPEDRSEPATYELLIDYLTHDQAAIRNLAAWHLVRLDPRGKDIAYNPAGSKSDCEAASAAWKKLIPGGQLPPAQKKN